MLLGLQLGTFRSGSCNEAIKAFLALQDEYSLEACEVHLEASLYEAACWPWDMNAGSMIKTHLRPSVSELGVHLPFFELNTISPNPRIADTSMDIMKESIAFAAKVQADYVVFHCRCGNVPLKAASRLWERAIADLASHAEKLGLQFCLENADDMRDPGIMYTIIKAHPQIKACLDIGHLYERIYPDALWTRRALMLNDILSPCPFLIKMGLPAAKSWTNTLAFFGESVKCLHVHNHNGRMAHQSLQKGRINLRPLRGLSSQLERVPIIIEADYRKETLQTVRDDLRWLKTGL